jgi:hypothetical protein
MDGDGDIDVVTESATDSLLVCFFNNGQGLFPDLVNISDLPIYSGPGTMSKQLILLDLDQDGDLDIMHCLYIQGDIYWYMNDGSGQFGPRTALLTIGSPTLFGDTADLDGDGLTDITLGEQIAWLRNTGSSSFEIVSQPYPLALRNTTADLDGDGDLDIAFLRAGTFDDEEVLLWTANDGNGGFGAPTLITTVSFGGQLGHADVDGDGDEDLLITRCWASEQGLHVHLNDGLGAFALGQTLLPSECLHNMDIADMDDDGDPDLLVHNSMNTLYLINNGGLFGPAVVVSSFNSPNPSWITTVAVADINGDGFLDVVDSHHASPGTYIPIQWYGNFPIPSAIGSEEGQTAFFAPNPLVERSKLVLPRKLGTGDSIELVDMNGRVALTLSGNGTDELVVERGVLNDGLYVLRVLTEDGHSSVIRIVVQ